jgi:hypothetical protein
MFGCEVAITRKPLPVALCAWRSLRALFLLSLCITLSSCGILVPVIDSFRQAGITPKDRKALLPKEIKKFQEALYWSNLGDAMALVATDQQDEVQEILQNQLEGYRVTESKVGYIKYDDFAWEGKAQVTVRSYRVPHYVVMDRKQEQVWKFSAGAGWQLHSITFEEVGAEGK